MAKSYFNNALVGNSGMLGCIDARGELIRLFWPDIDYSQHIGRMRFGVFAAGSFRNAVWFDEGSWLHTQRYIGDSNILETLMENDTYGIRVWQTDFVLPDKDVFVRRYDLENTGYEYIDTGFVVYSSSVSTNPNPTGVLFDYRNDALIHYRHGYYISISADTGVFNFQLGGNTMEAAERLQLCGADSIGMMPDGAAAWKTGLLKNGEKTWLTIRICASDSLNGIKRLLKEESKSSYQTEYEKTSLYWSGFLGKARSVKTGDAVINSLYRRSVLLFGLMADKKGGLLAAPEIDEDFTRCGRYAFCWGRDAAFITGAIDWCGLTDTVEKFYRWAADIQDEDGCWQQRYYTDGNLAPSWGLQVDETGSIIWGILQHFKATGDTKFLGDMWECVRKGVTFLIQYMDNETALPWLSYDLWEERLGEHAYSSAAVYAGIIAGARIGDFLKMPSRLTGEWREIADRIRLSIGKNFYKPEMGRFIRSIRVKLNPWGEEAGDGRIMMRLDSKGNRRDFTREDYTADISLLGLSVPFGVFDAGDAKMESTAEKLEDVLLSTDSGGLKRYGNDTYIGGNPWILATLWAALYRIEKKEYGIALKYLEWAAGGRTELGFLPEQVDRHSGKPVWVIPLTWSHAMFVLVMGRLIDAGVSI